MALLYPSARNEMILFTSHPTRRKVYFWTNFVYLELGVQDRRCLAILKNEYTCELHLFYEHTFHQGPWQGSTLSKNIIFLVYSHTFLL